MDYKSNDINRKFNNLKKKLIESMNEINNIAPGQINIQQNNNVTLQALENSLRQMEKCETYEDRLNYMINYLKQGDFSE